LPSPASLFAPPRVHEAPAPASWWDYFDQHRDLVMAPQVYDWTCSICASTWVLQATGAIPERSREATAMELGPDCCNPAVGLVDTACLVEMFEAHGFVAHQEWVDWNRALKLCGETTGVLNSTYWYHFVGVRGLYGSNQLWVANSAPGYRGIWDQIGYSQFQAWAGSWQMVWLER
jgi:hypothetical protein